VTSEQVSDISDRFARGHARPVAEAEPRGGEMRLWHGAPDGPAGRRVVVARGENRPGQHADDGDDDQCGEPDVGDEGDGIGRSKGRMPG